MATETKVIEKKDGLILRGTVVNRQRRNVEKDGKTRFMIVVTISDGLTMYQAETWSEEKLPEHVPSRGEKVELNVSIRPYNQGNVPRYALTFGPKGQGMEVF